jgi:hypothetical protein
MSFTQDELDAFNTILEQKLAIHRRELELSLNQRMSTLKQEFEQYLATIQQNLLQNLPSRLPVEQNGANNVESQHLQPYQTHVLEEPEQGGTEIAEIQAEIAWDDLLNVIDKVVGDRLSTLEGSIQSMIKNTERSLLTQLHGLRSDLMQARQGHVEPMTTDITNMQDVFSSVEQLEQLIEALQVTMTANHTLLSSRLYYHQHQPLERAHSTVQPSSVNDGRSEDEEN